MEDGNGGEIIHMLKSGDVRGELVVEGADGFGQGGETTMLNLGSAGTAGAAMSKADTGRDINMMVKVH